MATSSGLRSPVPRSDASSPRQKFDSDLLKAYMKKLLSSTFQGTSWPGAKEQDRVKDWIKDVGTRVKERMLEIQPRGYKFIVLTQINDNKGQGGRADLALHWETSDVVAQEMFSNDSLICICIAFAIQTY
ncbi:hypothetical protein FIBSPDRAFT_735530 [Athelia psychrophila]|uniref:Uncharacterized protein n=1 Tax=Athelia psychrophila TaxID=1759441 RepID=A0A166N574_9AGAM|nr:hypothetical protein FIBSPDRAFT_735530 [Fibularhizoctonia sp. CBS 109695]